MSEHKTRITIPQDPILGIRSSQHNYSYITRFEDIQQTRGISLHNITTCDPDNVSDYLKNIIHLRRMC